MFGIILMVTAYTQTYTDWCGIVIIKERDSIHAALRKDRIMKYNQTHAKNETKITKQRCNLTCCPV